MENLSEITGKNLSTLRKARGMTQQQLADVLHYSDKSISKWELGYACPSVDILKEFADYYGVTVDFLITPQSEETAKEVVSKEIASHSGANKAIVLALANVVVALIFTLIFVSNIINGHHGLSNVSFLFWALPACLFISLVTIRFLYGKQRIVSTILLSCFSWSILFGVILHFLFVAEPTMSLWYILVVGAPVQAILILFLFIKPVR
ncbi:MAG: helix-turn-helix transcriptional regulator [Candidatus Enteromonas sp.]|nr:helix-turn-helix transcriptional regulator [Candidatus Enteromonas sp.]